MQRWYRSARLAARGKSASREPAQSGSAGGEIRAPKGRKKSCCEAFLHEKYVPLYITRRLRHVFRLAEIAPVIFICTKGDNFFFLLCQPQIRRDDRENTIFGHRREQARRNHMHAAKGQRFRLP